MRLTTSELENVTIANALQLEAARRYPVLSRLRRQRHAKFEVAKHPLPYYSVVLLIHYFTL